MSLSRKSFLGYNPFLATRFRIGAGTVVEVIILVLTKGVGGDVSKSFSTVWTGAFDGLDGLEFESRTGCNQAGD